MPAYKMLLEYDGSRYRGWQRLGDTDMTVQGKVETALSRLFGTPVEISGSGRTDAGVHARGQVASFETVRDLPPAELLHDLRRHLPEDIGVISLDYAPPRFHARYNALEKTYCYRVWNSEAPCVFERRFVYVFPDRLDLDRMRSAAQRLLGEHDFRGFSAGRTKKSTVRTLSRLSIEQVGEELRFTLTADGFLQQMVRILVGTLLEIGRGERTEESIDAVFSRGVRADAGFTVPAKGLCLMEVSYR
jgi:tRNA pseudouridine38-40 synthase